MYLTQGGTCRSAFPRFLALSAALVALAACSDRIVEPAAQSVEAALTPVQSVVVSDIVERVTPSFGDETRTTLLARRFNELREHMEAGRLSDAATSIVRARTALKEAQSADDGTFAADLTVIELALDDASQELDAASALGQARTPR